MNFSNVLFVLACTAGADAVARTQIQQTNAHIATHSTSSKNVNIGDVSHRRNEAEKTRHHSFRGIEKHPTPEDPLITAIATDVSVSPRTEDALSGERFLEGDMRCEAGFVECDDGMAVIDGKKSTDITCETACDGKCCVGGSWGGSYSESCQHFTGAVCMDRKSCNGYLACHNAKISYVTNSCRGEYACHHSQISSAVDSCFETMSCTMFGGYRGAVGKVVNSCHGERACHWAVTGEWGDGGGISSVGDILDSCQGNNACREMAVNGGTIGNVVESCIGSESCRGMADRQPSLGSNGIVGNIINSCSGTQSCQNFGREGGVVCFGDITNSCNGDENCRNAFNNADVTGPLTDCCNDSNGCADVTSQPPQCASGSDYLTCGDDDPPLEWVGNNGGEVFPLGQCQGDCDSDKDCKGDLVCFDRDGATANAPVPHCSGYDDTGDDFCTIRPSQTYLAYMGNSGLPVNKFPLQLCEGDCDRDSECAGGLVCFKRKGRTPVPGCEGTGVRGKDYCINDV
eukprot:CAMPEP_0183763434 /NCGR_PEP_ID=MMETSP0739-20130205/9697_1 /TAXON_ID=385413 /ORGANISM="Thalassiosira miniscula, Strain CCMP1093" /LENGTH=513 /DNA_ID=CAMNT_0026001853 /DNA_START=121 /DNA_END=1662 /DNA_ORIENTATION=+